MPFFDSNKSNFPSTNGAQLWSSSYISSVMHIVLCMMGAAGNGCIRFEEPTGTENEGLHNAVGCWDKGWCFFTDKLT